MKMNARILIFYISAAAIFGCSTSENRQSALFELLAPQQTGVDFVNELIIDDSLNIMEFDYLYNGGGVAIGDFNNDTLPDIFFTGNKVSCRLYLNEGSMKFKDVTDAAGISTTQWAEGVTLVDLDNNGLLDIYVSTSSGNDGSPNANLLFMNNGTNDNGIPSFTEKASEYGINDQGYNTQAAFFDYDKDGDLDLYVLSNALETFNRNTTRPRQTTGKGNSTDKLYRNNGNGTFTNVSAEAGILIEGYGLGIVVTDINKDSWPDVYLANDFVTNDLLYINNGDGTFTNSISKMMKHQSHNGMGVDAADYNNDALVDIVVLDMMPDNNLRQKSMMIPFSNYDRFTLNLDMGYEPQYVRNTLQLNNGNGSFSEIGQLAGIYKTDWSWAPLLADFDNDGLKDLFVTNGYGKDITDLDYIVYSNSIRAFGTEEAKKRQLREEIEKLVEVKIPNYMFKNNGDLTFSDKTIEWGFEQPSLSNGVAFADLDNDGDLDLVTNNLNAAAFVYQNNTNRLLATEKNANFLKIDLNGDSLNLQGLGSKIILKYNNEGETEKQYYEHYLTRGYKSFVGHTIHFGLGSVANIDTLKITWPDGRYQRLTNIKANQLLTLEYENSKPATNVPGKVAEPVFAEVSDTKAIEYKHQAVDFVDFKIQRLLPHKHSENGPGIAVGDVNGDGSDDFYIGGSPGFPGKLFVQQGDGTFSSKTLAAKSIHDDMGSLFFDADNDGDLDLYIVSGGSRHEAGHESYRDRFYRNDGKGNFSLDSEAIPEILTSGSVVTAADYDQDGDLDLFVGGRLVPWQYPLPAKSYILRNEGGKFEDVTKEVCPEMEKFGLVTSAIWTDFNRDNQLDLLVAGEWMPITALKQQRSSDGAISFENVTASAGLANTSGWWNSIASGDFDNDGDMDYVAGNLGLNSKYKASEAEPVSVYVKDFDNNGSIDPIMFYYNQGKKYPVHSRNMLLSQVIYMRNRFPRYSDYGKTSFETFFREGELDNAYVLKSKEFSSSYIENLGNGQFELRDLPIEVQFSPTCGIVSEDFNKDGHQDLLMVGNSYATEMATGRYDASIGSYLTGDGKGNFKPVPSRKSGFFVEGDTKAMAKLTGGNGETLILVSQQTDSLKVFMPTVPSQKFVVKLQPLDQRVEIVLKNGEKRVREFYYGSAYLSQSSRTLTVGEEVASVVLYDYSGKSRTYKLPEGEEIAKANK